MSSNPDDPLALNFTSARMVELEKLVEDLRRDKRKAADNFAYEKVGKNSVKNHAVLRKYSFCICSKNDY